MCGMLCMAQESFWRHEMTTKVRVVYYIKMLAFHIGCLNL